MRGRQTQRQTSRRWLRWTILAGLALSVLTACTVSVSSGILGALASMGAVALIAVLVGGAQTGCIEDPAPDDAEVTACLSDAYIGPCLTPDQSPPDQSPPDLSPPDAMIIGPCLGAPLPDLGPDRGRDQGAPDMRVDDAGVPDLDVGPCLEPPPEPDQPPGKAMAPGGVDRAAIFAKVSAGLPPDIAARLVRPDDEV